MKLTLEGHGYRYAVEQIMLAMFPEARPEYSDEPPAEGEDQAVVTLTDEGGVSRCRVRLVYRGAKSEGAADAEVEPEDKLAFDRERQKIIRLAFFEAAMKILPERPVWGALTGIRPGTIMTNMLRRGVPEEEALRRMREEQFVSPERAELCLETARASLKVQRELEERDAALYVGIPFCPTRCAYCSFVSQSVERSMGLIEPFLDALRREIAATARVVRELGLRVIAVYIGGGTPTTLSAEELRRLLDLLGQEFDLSHVREFCVEAGRPDTITEDKLAALRGVTRISINPQSMNDAVLEAIGRHHRAADIREAYGLARRVIDADINMDLIAGLPADTPESFEKTLREVIAMGPENITVHTLALKKGTRITLEDTARPGRAEVGRMLDRAARELTAAGYAPYYLYRQKFMSGGFENVGWAKKGHESLYNILIMEELTTILAMGGGASTKLVNAKKGRIERIFDPKYPREYIAGMDKIISDKEKIIRFYGEERM